MKDVDSRDVVVTFPPPLPSRPLQFHWRLARTGEAGAQVRRRILRATSGHLCEEEQDVLRLLVSELVNNAVEHAGDTAGAEIMVELSLDDGQVKAAVWDGGEGFVGATVPLGHHNPRGRGLMLVDALASSWGTSLEKGTRVWFELARGLASAP